MATEYRLSYTADEIDSRLGKVIKLTEDTERLTADTERLATDIQKKVEVVELTTAEFNALNEAGNIDDKTFYSLTDVDEEVKIELDTTLTIEGQAADAKAVGDALANHEHSWNDLTDKPFYEETVVISEPVVINWDGNTDGLVTPGGDSVMYKVSDVVLTNEQIKSATYTLNNGSSAKVADMWDYLVSQGYITEDASGIGEAAVCVRKAGAVMLGFEFPETGIYFFKLDDMYTASINVEAIKETTIKPINEKYIPDTIARTSDIPSIEGLATEEYVDASVANLVNSAPEALNTLDELAAALGDDNNFATTVTNQIAQKISYAPQTLTDDQKAQARENIGAGLPQVQADWNQNDESAADYVNNRTHYVETPETVIFPETELSFEPNMGAMMSISSGTYNMEVGKTYIVTWDGVDYVCDAESILFNGAPIVGVGNTALVGVGENNGLPFSTGEIVGAGQIVTTTISGSAHKMKIRMPEVVEKLDNKYLDLDWFPISRTVHEPVGEPVEVLAETEASCTETITQNCCYGLMDTAGVLEVGDFASVVFDGVHYTLEVKEYSAYGEDGAFATLTYLGNASTPNIYNEMMENAPDTGEPFLILTHVKAKLLASDDVSVSDLDDIYAEQPGTHTISIFHIDGADVQKTNLLPTEYIPDSIARKTDITKEVFWAVYGTTTNAEILEAYEAGKICVVEYAPNVNVTNIAYLVNAPTSTNAEFCILGSTGYLRRAIKCVNDKWTSSTAYIESRNNRVSTIDENSLDTRYPSAKAVYDFVIANGSDNVLYTEQTLTEEQRLQARTNIGIIEASDIEAVELLAELEIATPVADGDAIYTDEQNNILII